MISEIYRQIYNCGKESSDITNLHDHSIRGFSRYIEIFYMAGQYNVQNLNLMHAFTLLMIDFDELTHLEFFETRYLSLINTIKNKSEFSVFRKVIYDTSLQNKTLIDKMKAVMLDFLKHEIIKREI